MSKPDHILIATDFSAPSRHAADRAARLAHASGARLVLMHVVPRRPGGTAAVLEHGAGERAQLLDEADAHLKARADAARGRVRPASGTAPCAPAARTTRCAEAAEAFDARLLVVGGRGAGSCVGWCWARRPSG